jgi:hypothetical protein
MAEVLVMLSVPYVIDGIDGVTRCRFSDLVQFPSDHTCDTAQVSAHVIAVMQDFSINLA